MTLRHLKIFATVYEESSITKAAKKLFISQPSVSFAIAEIESYYNVKLFERVKQRIIKNEKSTLLYEHACQTLNSFSSFEETALKLNTNEKLSFGCSLTIGQYIAPKIIKFINKKYPKVFVSTKINQARTIEELVIKGMLDFGLIESECKSTVLSITPFSRDRLSVVCRKDYDLSPMLSMEELQTYKFALREQGSAARYTFDEFLEKNKLTIEPSIEATNTQVIISCLLYNDFISILPFNLVKEYIEKNQLKELKIDGFNLERTYNIISLKNKVFSPIQKEILQAIQESSI